MKKSRLTRKTALQRGASQLSRRNARLRAVGKKKAKREMALKPAHRKFIEDMACCCLCGCRSELTRHEIFGGALRDITVADRHFWLCACWFCHKYKLQHMTKVGQLRLKRMTDPSWYSVARVNEVVSGGRGERFNEGEV